jgi:hypothetical protein
MSTEPVPPAQHDMFSRFFLSERAYAIDKWLVMVVIPAFGTLYFALSQIWGFPAGKQVLGTLASIQTFLGVLLGVSSVNYNHSDVKYAGTMNVIEQEDKTVYSLELNGPPEDLEKKKEVTFKVAKPPSQ